MTKYIPKALADYNRRITSGEIKRAKAKAPETNLVKRSLADPNSLKLEIHAICYCCFGGSEDGQPDDGWQEEIRDCSSWPPCPLHDFRPYKKAVDDEETFTQRSRRWLSDKINQMESALETGLFQSRIDGSDDSNIRARIHNCEMLLKEIDTLNSDNSNEIGGARKSRISNPIVKLLHIPKSRRAALTANSFMDYGGTLIDQTDPFWNKP